MSKAAELLAGESVPYFLWTAIFGTLIAFLVIIGPLAVTRQWLGKFAVWIAYGSSAVIIVNLLISGGLGKLAATHTHDLSLLSALDLVIAMPVSWMPLAADYNRFAKKGSKTFKATLLGFALTNSLFYFGGLLIGTSDVVTIVVAIEVIFSGFLMLLLLVDEADNAFADVYSAALSAQNIFPKIGQKYIIVGFSALSVIIASFITIQDYESFLLLIGIVFVPLFGVVLTDYYVLNRAKYTDDMIYSSKLRVSIPAMIAWAMGIILALILSPLSPIFVAQLPPMGATIPSLGAASIGYLLLSKVFRRQQLPRLS